jgi:oxygen-independent coproporphyrinogen-3 oxidase
MDIDQIAAYPLFQFPYTKMGGATMNTNYNISSIVKRRKMLHMLESIFYDAGYERTSVWAFTKKGVPKYCSVTVPLYIGLGASGGSYLKDIYWLHVLEDLFSLDYVSKLWGTSMQEPWPEKVVL